MKRSKHHHHKRCSTWWCLRSVISKWRLQTFNQEMHCFQFQTIILKAQKKATTFVHDKIMSLCHRLRYNYCKAIKMNSNFRVAILFTKVFRSELLYQDTAMWGRFLFKFYFYYVRTFAFKTKFDGNLSRLCLFHDYFPPEPSNYPLLTLVQVLMFQLFRAYCFSKLLQIYATMSGKETTWNFDAKGKLPFSS